ncbi:hypothetical protein Q8W40_21185 [Vibrio penaeicida]|uniref:hypothetical protein n=1 Tax=Vibrio penaeicida TaxID=104609 RepID=UPI002732F659|nr:hypothetical protein [Vibrio penaeicida]MDP2574718.1 hypothetical protein [Vibrio penaeicida]
MKTKVALACITTLVLSGCGGGSSEGNEGNNVTAVISEPIPTRISKKFIDFDNDGVPEFETLYTYNSDGYVTSELTRRLTSDKNLKYGNLLPTHKSSELIINFDDKNFPVYIEELFNGVSSSKTQFTFDGSKKISNIVKGNSTYHFSYNSGGNTQKIDVYNSENTIIDTYTYTYNQRNQLTEVQSQRLNFNFGWNKDDLIRTLDVSGAQRNSQFLQNRQYTYESGKLKRENISSTIPLDNSTSIKYFALFEYIHDEKTGKPIGEKRIFNETAGNMDNLFSYEALYEVEEGVCVEVGNMYAMTYKTPRKSGKTTQLLNNCNL